MGVNNKPNTFSQGFHIEMMYSTFLLLMHWVLIKNIWNSFQCQDNILLNGQRIRIIFINLFLEDILRLVKKFSIILLSY